MGSLSTVPPSSSLSEMPTFNPSQGDTSGLELLAADAASSSVPTSSPAPTTATQGQSLMALGPFNPAAMLPTKLVKKILDLEFVEM